MFKNVFGRGYEAPNTTLRVILNAVFKNVFGRGYEASASEKTEYLKVLYLSEWCRVYGSQKTLLKLGSMMGFRAHECFQPKANRVVEDLF